jgi:CBS domain-containing protein
MAKGRFGSAVVMQGQVLVGIFTERDVLRAAASGSDLTRSPVSRWMTRDPETVGPHVDSERAAEIMLGSGFAIFPWLRGPRWLGS